MNEKRKIIYIIVLIVAVLMLGQSFVSRKQMPPNSAVGQEMIAP